MEANDYWSLIYQSLSSVLNKNNFICYSKQYSYTTVPILILYYCSCFYRGIIWKLWRLNSLLNVTYLASRRARPWIHNINHYTCWVGVAVDIQLGTFSRFINIDLKLMTCYEETNLIIFSKTYLIAHTVLASFSSMSCFLLYPWYIFLENITFQIIYLDFNVYPRVCFWGNPNLDRNWSKRKWKVRKKEQFS